jgi:hypothetical protein
MTRRSFLAAPAAAMAARERVTREVFVRAPGPGVAVIAHAFYTERTGGALVSVEQRLHRSDTIDAAWYRYSKDNGRTWSAPVEKPTGEKRPEGMLRRHPRACFVEPVKGRLLEFRVEGILPSDDPLEGMRQWNLYYRMDGADHQLIQEGAGFDPRHPLPGVYTGRNCVMLGDVASAPYAAKDGSILVPTIVSLLEGNPGGGYTYTDALVVHGRWRGNRLVWRAADRVKADPQRSTRGMDEPTIESLEGGRLLMVMRGSNDKKPDLPGYRWVSYASDGGWHWTAPEPWTYHDGTPFYSPSAASQLLRHSSGRLFWMGHISDTNPRGNRPRYPFYVVELDQGSGRPIRDRRIRVDDREADEDPILMLTGNYAREDRETHEIALHMSRIVAPATGFRGNAFIYRISV